MLRLQLLLGSRPQFPVSSCSLVSGLVDFEGTSVSCDSPSSHTWHTTGRSELVPASGFRLAVKQAAVISLCFTRQTRSILHNTVVQNSLGWLCCKKGWEPAWPQAWPGSGGGCRCFPSALVKPRFYNHNSQALKSCWLGYSSWLCAGVPLWGCLDRSCSWLGS